ncbi:MAG: energy transducer TonB [Bacteroidota bacterium]
MKKERKPESFLRKPTFRGGPKAMRKFIGEHLKYPPEAQQEKIEGTVRLKMDISHQGKVIGTKVLSGLGYGCDEEAARVVKLLTFEVPKMRKIRATFHKTINIHFRLPKKKAPTTKPSQVKYTITPNTSSGKENQEEQDSGGGYEYTISW